MRRMVIQEERYLAHYGVLGMKWGVKRARKKAVKEDGNRSRLSTGKNYDKVYNELKKAKKSINDEYSKELNKLADRVVKYNNRVLAGVKDDNERAEIAKINQKINSKYYKASEKLVDKFADRFNEATLKDIGYKDIEKGKAYLKKHKKIIFDVEL